MPVISQEKTESRDATDSQKVMSWVIALSEEVSATQPLSVDCGDERIVLWRDTGGIVRALENRCPHRRVELSRGCILPEGTLRCGYHGWTWDGASGKLVNIPNLKGQNQFSSQYQVRTYPVWEEGGFVRLGIGFSEIQSAPDKQDDEEALPLSGMTAVSLGFEHYMAAFFDGPALLMNIPGVRFTEYFRGDLHYENGLLVLERYCNWAGRRADTRFTGDFPLVLRTVTHPVSGETRITLTDGYRRIFLTALMAPVAADRGTTFIRWRAALGAHLGIRRLWLNRRQPIIFSDAIDGLALRNLLRSPSIHWQRLRTDATESRVITLLNEGNGYVA